MNKKIKKYSEFPKEVLMIKEEKINEIEFINPTEIGLDLINHKSGYTIDIRKYGEDNN